MPVDNTYDICVDGSGCIYVDGVHTTRLTISNTPITASFTAVKVNTEDSTPLAGAVYTLYMNATVVASTVSDAAGQVTFTGLSPGTYQLVETTPPPGFRTNTESLTVVVAQNGSVTINGLPANGFILGDVPVSEFIFRKLDALTRQPLAGATFTLTQNGTVINTATSDVNGLVYLGILAAGTYQLEETVSPPGYQANTTVYQVVVGADGAITVNGVPLAAFEVTDTPIPVSATPTIDTIIEGAEEITGTGIAESLIVVTLPSGSTVATVNSEETWQAAVPAGIVLAVGDIVYANQTEIGKLESANVQTTVVANTEIVPSLDVFLENLTTGLDSAAIGDLILYDAIISNDGTASSVWESAFVTFELDSLVTLQEASIRMNNREASPGQYNYASAANTLTVYLGDIVGGSSVSVSFRVTVTSDISDIDAIVLNVTLG